MYIEGSKHCLKLEMSGMSIAEKVSRGFIHRWRRWALKNSGDWNGIGKSGKCFSRVLRAQGTGAEVCVGEKRRIR